MFKKGFASTFFLVIFMYVSMFTALISLNDADSIRTLINLEENQKYFIQEMQIIKDFECMLKNNSACSGEYYAGNIPYTADVFEDEAYLTSGSVLQEVITVNIDAEKKKITEYSVVRSAGKIQ